MVHSVNLYRVYHHSLPFVSPTNVILTPLPTDVSIIHDIESSVTLLERIKVVWQTYSLSLIFMLVEIVA